MHAAFTRGSTMAAKMGWSFYVFVFYLSLLYLRDGTYMKQMTARRMTAMQAQRDAAAKAKAAETPAVPPARGKPPKEAFADDEDFDFADDEFGDVADAKPAAGAASPSGPANTGTFDAGPQADDDPAMGDDYGPEASADASDDSGFDDDDGFGGDDDEDDDGEFADQAEPAVTRASGGKGGGRGAASSRRASVEAKTKGFGRASVFKVVVQYCVS